MFIIKDQLSELWNSCIMKYYIGIKNEVNVYIDLNQFLKCILFENNWF